MAGDVGVWVMDRVDWYAFEHEDPAARRRTERVRPAGLDPAHKLANSMANAAGVQLRPAQPHPAGSRALSPRNRAGSGVRSHA